MKLITRATTYFFGSYVIVMIVGAVFLYFTIRSLVYKQIDSTLLAEKNIIQVQIDQTDTIPDFAPSLRRLIEVKFLNSTVRFSEVFRDTSIYDRKSDSYGSYRCLAFTSNTSDGVGYSIRIIRPLDEREELLQDIGMYMFYLFFLILIASILINYFVSKNLWNPFYVTVRKASSFNVQNDMPLGLPDSDTDEFRQLNAVINQMTERMKRDYLNLKEYNEDASHEIQTPIAIIRSKMEILMQNKNLRKEDLDLIKTINEATDRLLKLNQGLLLISKIGNNYFQNPREISLRQIIINYLNDYQEIIQIKNITTEITGDDPAMVMMDETLADILISNLISNAVRYNIKDGLIRCHTENDQIKVSNTGIPLAFEPGELFRRFRKGSGNQQSVGLGLSIVKKIADNYGIGIKYLFSEGLHEVTLTFRDTFQSKTG